MHCRLVCTLGFAAAAFLAVPIATAQSLRTIDPIANPGFEETVPSTDGSSTQVLGGYWEGAENLVYPSGQPSHLNVLAMAVPGQFAQQRFPAYEYVAQGTAGYEGASDSTTITGDFIATDQRVEARVILEESRSNCNAASWGFYDTATSGSLNFGSAWRYMSRNGSGTWSDMTWVPSTVLDYLGYYQSTQDPDTVIRLDTQSADSAAAAARCYEAPTSGRLLIQCRIAWDRMAIQPSASSAAVTARIRKYDNHANMTLLQDIMPATTITTGDGVDVCYQVNVSTGNLIAFETSEGLSPSPKPVIIFDPSVSYESRQVVYRFGHNLGSLTSTYMTYYAPPIDVPAALTWQPFSLPAGADYVSHFAQYDGSLPHGPVPQLSVRLEYYATTASVAVVAFDNVHVTTDFRTQTEQQLSDEIRVETERLIDNHMQYGVDFIPATTDYNLHVSNDFNIATAAQTPRAYGVHGPLSDVVASYSTQFFHPDATPWLLNEVDSIVRNRHSTLGIVRKYDFSGHPAAYVDPTACGQATSCINPPNCEKVLVANDILFLLSVYDVTHDFDTLAAAYQLGEDILTYGGSTVSPLYQGTFFYTLPGGVPTLEPAVPASCYIYAHLDWGQPLQALATLASRTAPYASGPFTLSSTFQSTATAMATWIKNTVAAAPGQYGAYWLRIDNPLDDTFGYISEPVSKAERALPDSTYEALLAQGAAHFQPEWIQTFPRATGMAGDQQRAWDAWLIGFELSPTTNLAYGKAYLDATLNYVRTGQLGNGVWSAVNASEYHQPDLGALFGTPLWAADAHKLLPIGKAYGNSTLASAGVVTSSIKADLLAYYSTMFHLNAKHYGHYLEHLAVTTNQLGYMDAAAYPPSAPSIVPKNAGLEFRAIAAAADMLSRLEPSLANDRPTATVSPGNLGFTAPGSIPSQTFTCVDPDGYLDFLAGDITIDVSVFSGGSLVTHSVLHPITDPAFSVSVTPPNTVTFTWVVAPTLVSGQQYRFQLIARDGGDRWDMDSATYKIP